MQSSVILPANIIGQEDSLGRTNRVCMHHQHQCMPETVELEARQPDGEHPRVLG